MNDRQKYLHPSRSERKLPPGLEALYDPELQESFRRKAEEISKRSGYDPTASEVREMMGKALGGRTLKEVLRELDDRKELSDPSS